MSAMFRWIYRLTFDLVGLIQYDALPDLDQNASAIRSIIENLIRPTMRPILNKW